MSFSRAVSRYLQSDAGRTAVFGDAAWPFAEPAQLDGEDADGVRIKTTTYVADSHLRMQWHRPDWNSASILQIRVTEKSPSKTTVSFHQEKLPTELTREEMRERRRGVCATIAAALS
jgi:uncharacterized protein YndB with AHSA1/START domain